MTRKYANSLIQLTKWTKDAGPRTKDLPHHPAPETKGRIWLWTWSPDTWKAAPEELKRKQKWNYVAPVAGLEGVGRWSVWVEVGGGSHTKSETGEGVWSTGGG